MAMQKGINGGGGRHDGNHGKPSYMSHIPDTHLKTKTPEYRKADSMTCNNLMKESAANEEA